MAHKLTHNSNTLAKKTHVPLNYTFSEDYLEFCFIFTHWTLTLVSDALSVVVFQRTSMSSESIISMQTHTRYQLILDFHMTSKFIYYRSKILVSVSFFWVGHMCIFHHRVEECQIEYCIGFSYLLHLSLRLSFLGRSDCFISLTQLFS